MQRYAGALLGILCSAGCQWLVGIDEVADKTDASTADASTADASTADASTADASTADASEPDAGEPDAGEPDAGEPDAAVDQCGDGTLGAFEGCDDHNTTSFDGCSASCAVELGWSCTGSAPSRCAPTGMVMVPAGPFVMGCDASDPGAQTDEQPEHIVTVSAYYIDQHEVTNAEYRACVAANACTAPGSLDSATHTGYHTDPAYDDYPVINVNWSQLVDYCAWLGKRLPTEAEWEKAARGGCEMVAPPTCGEEDERTYPWGEDAPTCALANFSGCELDTDAVGARSPSGDSPYGAQDMAGNAFEWVEDFYGSTYYESSPDTDPQGPASGPGRCMRSGSWTFGADLLRVASRGWDDATAHSSDRGGRCAEDAALRFEVDDLYVLSASGGLFNVTGGGDLSTAPVTPTPGLTSTYGTLAWSHDRQVMYVGAMGSADKVFTVTPDGVVQDYATGIPNPAGVLVTRDGHILVAAFDGGEVLDITGGGDFSGAAALATGIYHAGAIVQLDDGTVLVISGSGGSSVYNINYPTGGAMTAGDQYATGLINPVDIVQAPDGEIYVSLASNKVFKITGGGNFSAATPFATATVESGLTFRALVALRDGTLLAQTAASGNVADIYDITAGGEITSSTTPWGTMVVVTQVLDQVPYFEEGP